jgi:integrase
MASTKFEKRLTKSGTVYRTRFMVNYCSFSSPWLSTVQEVQNWEVRKRLEILDGVVATGSHQLLKDYAKEWLEKYAYTHKVYAAALRDEQFLRVHLLPVLGHLPLKDITTRDVSFLISDLKRRGSLAGKTINNCLGTFKKMLNDAVAWGYLRVNPAAPVKPLKLCLNEVSTFTFAEISLMLDYCKAHCEEYYELLLFAVNTGCRLGECISLTWDKVDLEIGLVTITHTWDELHKTTVARTKGKRFRKVPLNAACRDLLRKMILNGRAKQPNSLVFPDVSYHAITRKRFKNILLKSGCDEALKRRATFHCLRHTFASEFMRRGGNIYELQKVLGHSSVTQTEKYAHFAPNHLQGLTDRVSFIESGKVVSLASKLA